MLTHGIDRAPPAEQDGQISNYLCVLHLPPYPHLLPTSSHHPPPTLLNLCWGRGGGMGLFSLGIKNAKLAARGV
jgi:hypothetical protein